LQAERIDLYQIHWAPDDNGTGLEESWQTLAAFAEEGKVRWIGVSNFNVEQMKRAERIAPITSLQPPVFDLFAAASRRRFSLTASIREIGVIVLRSDGIRVAHRRHDRERAAALPADDSASRIPNFVSRAFPRISRSSSVFAKLERAQTTPGEVAIAWTLPIPGHRRHRRRAQRQAGWKASFRAGDVKLSAEEIAEIEGAAALATARSYS